MSAAVLFTVSSVALPSNALGAAYKEAACDTGLRTKPWWGASRKAVIRTGTAVTASTTVRGGYWRIKCGGRIVTGNTWYRIASVAWRSAKSRYGVSYVYAPVGNFRSLRLSRYAACDGVKLRTLPRTSATRKATVPAGTNIGLVATVTGGSWTATCGGRTVSGNTWYRIATVNGTRSLYRYGYNYVYAATGLFSSTAPKASAPAPGAATDLTEGIDVSHWQGSIDWAKVRAAGKRFAYIKASEHTSFVDNKYATNKAAAKAAGLYVGAYHFARPDGSSGDAVKEADHFVATAKISSGDLLPVLDLEDTGGLSASALQNWVRSFLDRVYERTGVRGVIYVSPSFWSTKMANTGWFASNGYQVLWIAHWTTASEPSVPAGNWGGKSWTFWQYTSDGSVPGISGRVDLDRYNGTNFSKVLVP